MIRRHIGIAFLVVGIGIVLAWNVEIFVIGRGLISNYLAPVGLLALSISLFLIHVKPKE